MRNAGDATAGQDADAFSGAEHFIGTLGDGQEPAVIQLNGDLQTFVPRDAFLDRATGQAAGDGADDGADHSADGAATASAQRAAGDTADDCARTRANRRFGAFDLYFTHAFYDTQLDFLHLTRLSACIGAAGSAGGAACQQGCRRQHAG